MASARDQLLTRDGRACVWCGREVWEQDLTVEHLLPRSRGGTSTRANLLLACKTCNHQRRSKALAAYARQRADDGHTPRWTLLLKTLASLEREGRRAEREYAARQRLTLERHLASEHQHRRLMQSHQGKA